MKVYFVQQKVMPLEVTIAEAEKQCILNVLSAAVYNKVHAAKILDISRPTLYAKIEEYNISINGDV